MYVWCILKQNQRSFSLGYPSKLRIFSLTSTRRKRKFYLKTGSLTFLVILLLVRFFTFDGHGETVPRWLSWTDTELSLAAKQKKKKRPSYRYPDFLRAVLSFCRRDGLQLCPDCILLLLSYAVYTYVTGIIKRAYPHKKRNRIMGKDFRATITERSIEAIRAQRPRPLIFYFYLSLSLCLGWEPRSEGFLSAGFLVSQ